MAELKLFLFDLDGTLLSSLGVGLKALDKAFTRLFGIKNMSDTVDPRGKTDPAIFREILRLHREKEMTAEEYDLISQTYVESLRKEIENADQVNVINGVQPFLDFLERQNDVTIGLGTGNLELGARIKMSPTPLGSYFNYGGFGSDAELRTDVLRIGHARAEEAAQEKIDSKNVYIFGDTPLDVAAAKEAGYQSVAVATGGVSCDVLARSQPAYLLNSLEEGPAFYERSV